MTADEIGAGIRHLRTREATRQRLADLVGLVRHEHLVVNPETSFDAAATRAAAPMDRTLIDRGVAIRVLGVSGAHVTPTVPPAPTAAFREAGQVPMKLIVVDRKVAFFPVDPRDYDRGYLEVAQPPVVESLVALFERHWDAAHEPEGVDLPMITLSPREQILVALLAAGHTDATAARQMRLSERSVSTIMRSLMDRLAVDNRFQLGIALGALRVVPLPPGMMPGQPQASPPTDTVS